MWFLVSFAFLFLSSSTQLKQHVWLHRCFFQKKICSSRWNSKVLNLSPTKIGGKLIFFFVPQPNFFSRSAQSGNGRRVSVERRPKRGRNRNRKSLGSLFRWSWKFGTETGWETTRPVSNALITNNWISMLESAHSKSVQTSRTIWTQSDIKRALNSSTYPR